ncbi:MAG: type III pantothenate kinase [Planctomycetes bacterium]|nr:type III pantothenate kinase [Planctomycetota bacterium]MCC7170870.1 type III pantothenate kinase [Planctomycetota bacterium]
MVAVLAFDIGNTSIKAGIVERGVVRERAAFTHDRFARDGATWWGALAFDGPIGIASVRPEATSRVIALLRGKHALLAPTDFHAPITNACDPPESVGQDRLFLAAAAYALVGGAVVAVSLGTAITVNLVDASGTFRGGAIAIGVAAALRALVRETGLLPLVEIAPGEAVPALGRETHAAIRSGVARGAAGLVDRLIADIAQGPATVVVTGGDAALLVPFLATPVRVEADLALIGIALGVERAVGAAS